MIIKDPAQIPEHAIQTVNAICTDTFRFTIICVRFTCSRFCFRLSSALSSSTSSRIASCALDWNQYFTILIIQSLCCQFFDIFALSFLTSAFCVHRPNRLGSEILCLGFWSVLTITFDSSWSNLLSHLSLLPDLKHCVPFFSTCCTSTCFSACCSPAVGFALLC